MESSGVKHTEKSSEVFEPFTPDFNKEKSVLVVLNSPPSVISISSPLKTKDCLDSCEDISPCTPKQDVFDPFAPGCEELALAPLVQKYLSRALSSISRKLDFDSALRASPGDNVSECDSDVGRGKDSSSSDEEELLESVYGSLLEVIIRKQTEEVIVVASVSPLEENPILAKLTEDVVDAPVTPTVESPIAMKQIAEVAAASASPMEETECDNDPKTPSSTPLLNGVAETCPNAPVKAAPPRRARNIDSGLCRKLEF